MRHQLLIIRILALVALAVSTAQLADRLSGAGAFCSFEGDCEAVTASAYGEPLGVPLPVVGVVGFAFLFALTLLPESRGFRLLRPLTVVAGVVGLGLLVVQLVVLRRVCPLCAVVDSSAIGLAVVVLLRRPVPTAPVRVRLVCWIVAGIAALFFPALWSLAELPPPVPDQVKAQWEPGRVTVVELTDFDCPACKRADAVFQQVLPHHDVRLVRLVVPMPKHENARPAGRAYVAALRQGKGEEMAAALFAADVRNAERCRELAAKIGLDLAEYDRTLDDYAVDAQFNATIDWSQKLGTGVPLIWVQDRLLPGVPSVAALENTIRRAKPYQP